MGQGALGKTALLQFPDSIRSQESPEDLHALFKTISYWPQHHHCPAKEGYPRTVHTPGKSFLLPFPEHYPQPPFSAWWRLELTLLCHKRRITSVTSWCGNACHSFSPELKFSYGSGATLRHNTYFVCLLFGSCLHDGRYNFSVVYLLPYLQCLEYMTHGICLISICWMNTFPLTMKFHALGWEKLWILHINEKNQTNKLSRDLP